MKHLILIAVVFLSGCSTIVEPEHYKWAEEVCQANEGLDYMRKGYGANSSTVSASCNNSAEFYKQFDFKS